MPGAASDAGRGRKVLSVARNADLIVLVADVFQLDQIEVIRKELHEIGIRINARPPNVTIEKAGQGGLSITATCTLTKLSVPAVHSLLGAYGIQHGKVVIREDVDDDELIDAVAGNRHYVPAITVLNKVDLVSDEYIAEARRRLGESFLSLSAEKNSNLDKLKEAIYTRLSFIRVYLKPRDGGPDFDAPLIVTAGSTVFDVCAKIHRSFAKEARYALVSGASVRFNNQQVGLDHVVDDGDVLTIVR
jgi:ribosome-interacting GTPase 1